MKSWMILGIILVLGWILNNVREGFGTRGIYGNIQSSSIDDDISQGNSSSWSRRPNPLGKGPELDNPQIVYQGTPLPLAYETRLATPPADSMFYLARHRCSPDCCPSPYSCDHGCVCQHYIHEGKSFPNPQ